MADCSTCQLFDIESESQNCLHVNRPGGLDLTRLALDKSNFLPAAEVLEVASGLSDTLQLLTHEYKLEALGLEFSINMIQKSKKVYPGLSLVQANCANIPLKAESIFGVMMECALSLSGSIAETLLEYHRILEPNGILIISDVYIRTLLDPDAQKSLKSSHCLAEALTEASIRQLLGQNGFKIILWQDQTTLLKQWLARIVFKLGSLQSFFNQITASQEDAILLEKNFSKNIKLGYYLMIAEKIQ